MDGRKKEDGAPLRMGWKRLGLNNDQLLPEQYQLDNLPQQTRGRQKKLDIVVERWLGTLEILV